MSALIDAGLERLVVLNRTPDRAAQLADHFGTEIISGGLVLLAGEAGRAGLIVNTTPVGMTGSGVLTIDWSGADREAIATDVVYTPLETPFLRNAAERGLRTVDGLGMLLHQAAPGFERWFGRRPVVDEALRRAVLADLRGG